jgi:hypothetical protein
MTLYPPGIYIDDTGNDKNSDSLYFHKDRQSWAAVIVPEHLSSEVENHLDALFTIIKAEYETRFNLGELRVLEILCK